MTPVTRCPKADEASREMFAKGGWRPGRWTTNDQHLLVAAAYGMAVVRAIDYATGDDPKNRVIAVAEVVMPLCWWAICLIVASLVLLYGWRSKRHFIVTAGHVMLAALYGSLSLGTIASYAHPILDGLWDVICLALAWTGWTPHPAWDPWKLDGIRNAGPLLLVCMVHALTALRTGLTPLDAIDHAVETVGAPPDGDTANG